MPLDEAMLDMSDAAILARTTAIAEGPLADVAQRVDGGHYPLEVMSQLGAAGTFAPHLDRHGRRYGTAIAAMAAVGRTCGATAFLTWAQDVCGLYIEQSGNPALTGALLDGHARGLTFGGTALSNPMKTFAGIEKMLLRATRVPGGYVVNGTMPWVSHIAEDQYCGAVAAVVDHNGDRTHDIMFLLRFDGRAVRRHCPTFSAMEGTSTWQVQLTDFFVGQDDMIADPVAPYIQRIRAAFVLLQCGIALGISMGSIDAMLAVEQSHGHVNAFLNDRPDELADEAAELQGVIMRLAETPFDGSKDYLIDVLDARVRGAEFTLRASQSALLHQGARGYLMNSTPQRRIREAHFVAIVTPAIKHLRWEIARLSREVYPVSGVAA